MEKVFAMGVFDLLKVNSKVLCENCFSQLKDVINICPFCGYHQGVSLKYPSALPVGTILIGRYIIGKVLGKGGFGVTYLVYDTKEERKVAIKEYFPDYLIHRNTGETIISTYEGNKEDTFKAGMEKFFEEAKTLARFNGHPNIVNVYEFFYENNTAYFVMEYIEGVDLKGYVELHGGILNPDELSEIVRPVMDALIVVHSVGILHRDISPDNIYITDNKEIKLIDFGAARQVLGEQSKSLSVVLKPGFAPIEQYQTKGRQGPWTDVYALASTIYFCLTGQIPEASMDRIEEDTLKTPDSFNNKIPVSIEQSLLRALSVRAVNRYQTIADFKNDFLINQDIDTIIKNGDVCRSKKAFVKIIAAVVGIVVVLTAILFAAGLLRGQDNEVEANINMGSEGIASTSIGTQSSEAPAAADSAEQNTPSEASKTTSVSSGTESAQQASVSVSEDAKKDSNNKQASATTSPAQSASASQVSPVDTVVIKEEDLTLKALSISGYSISPAFNPQNQEYQVSVAATETRLKVNTVKSGDSASVTISGDGVDTKTTLSATKVNKITITVKGSSGKQKVYTINAIRKNEYNKDPSLTNGGEVAAIPKHMHYEDGKLLVIVRVFNNGGNDVKINTITFSVYDRRLDTASNPQHYFAKDSFTYEGGIGISTSDKYKDMTLTFTGSGLINSNGDLTCLWWTSNVSYSRTGEE